MPLHRPHPAQSPFPGSLWGIVLVAAGLLGCQLNSSVARPPQAEENPAPSSGEPEDSYLTTAAPPQPGPAAAPPPADAAPPPATPTLSSAPLDTPHWAPERDDAEIESIAAELCRSLKPKQRLLLEFSAPWCTDCRRLKQMERQEPLRRALARWARLEINVRDFEKNDRLLRAFSVRSIAHWVALQGGQCEKSLANWPRLDSRSVEPTTQGASTPDEIANWLDNALR